MSDITTVLVTASVVLASVGIGGFVVWVFMRTRGRQDHVDTLCHLLSRTVNAALLDRDEQLTRVLAEEKTKEAIPAAHESSEPHVPGRLPMSPAYSSGPRGRGEFRVDNMP